MVKRYHSTVHGLGNAKLVKQEPLLHHICLLYEVKESGLRFQIGFFSNKVGHGSNFVKIWSDPDPVRKPRFKIP